MFKSLSHLLLAGMFITGGYGAFSNPGPRASRVDQAGIPAPHEATILNGAAMMIAGLALALNIFPKLAALILAGTLIPTTLVGHPFWKEQNQQTRATQQIQFTKNLAMLGGLLGVLAEK